MKKIVVSLGLLGLAGLAGVARRDRGDARRESYPTTDGGAR